MSADAVQVWFHRLYQELGFSGASSHFGRRTLITRIAKKIVEAGGSLRDVRELAGQKAGSFELRAALSLAKLYQLTDRATEAQAVLSSALEGFSPRPEFPEIAEAQALA